MGFSVSGAAAIIFATMFVTFGMWFTASANSFESVSDAETDKSDRALEAQNTAISIANVTYNNTSAELTVVVTNTGAAQLSVETTDLLVDGQYQRGWEGSATVAGTDTRLWLAGEQLTITVATQAEPGRVKIVTENGVSAATTEVTLA
ncbi:flagellin [Salinibaculum salinum]|uniref:flagellin n=1 Tax=Salinibaculum salinum TaxID=3131996 RepID=UPI0030EB979C